MSPIHFISFVIPQTPRSVNLKKIQKNKLKKIFQQFLDKLCKNCALFNFNTLSLKPCVFIIRNSKNINIKLWWV